MLRDSAAAVPLHVLIVEDYAPQVTILVHELERSGFQPTWQHVETEETFLAALDPPPDLILTDYHLLGFGALRVLELLQSRKSDIPCIVVTGTVDEEVVVDCLRRGAADYLLKGRLCRLGAAVQHALDGRKVRAERAGFARHLHESEERFRRLLEHAPDVVYRFRLRPDPGFDYISPSLRSLSRYNPEQVLADPAQLLQEIHPEDRPALEALLSGDLPPEPIVLRWTRRSGGVVWTELHQVAIRDAEGTVIALEGIARDITHRVHAEQALRESEARFRRIAENAPDAIFRFRLAPTPECEYVSAAVTKITGHSPEEHCADPKLCLQAVHPSDRPLLERMLRGMLPADHELTLRWCHKDGSIVWTEMRLVPVYDESGSLTAVEGIARDITERLEANRALRESEQRFRQLAEAIREVFWLTDPRQPEILYISPAFTELWGRAPDFLAKDPWQLLETIHPDDRPRYREALEQQARGTPTDIEYRIQRPDGKIRWVRDRAFPVRGDDGTLQRVAGIAEDVTALKHSSERFREIVESAPDAMVIMNSSGQVVLVNSVAESVFGYTRAELLGQPIETLLPERFRTGHVLQRNAYLAQPTLRSLGSDRRVIARHKSGAEFPAEISLAPLTTGDEMLVLAAVRDVSGNVRAEQELRDSEQRFRTLFEASSAAVMILDERRFLDCNPATLAMFGCTREQFLRMHPADLSPLRQPDGSHSLVAANECIARALRLGSYRFDWVHRRRDGTDFPAEVLLSAMDLGGKRVLQAMVTDISERVKRERELHFLNNLFKQTRQPLVVTTLDGRLVRFNRAFERLTGYAPVELYGRRHADLTPPRWHHFEQDVIAEMLGTNEAIRYEKEYRRKHGTIVPVELYVDIYRNANGDAEYLYAFVSDATERKRAQDQLARQALEAKLLHQATMSAAETDSFEEALQQCVDIVCKITGWPVGHVYIPAADGSHLTPTEIWHLADPPAYASFRDGTMKTTFAKGLGLPGRIWETVKPEWIPNLQTNGAVFLRTRLSEEVHVKGAFGFPIVVTGELAAILEFFTSEEMAVDEHLLMVVGALGEQVGRVLERRRASETLLQKEEQIHQIQKLDAVGKLAGGVAHDFNNLLTGIIGYSQLLLHRDLDPSVHNDIQNILGLGRRAADLTQQLLAFSRKQTLQPRVLSPNAVVAGLGKMLHRLIGEDIAIELHLAPDVGSVRADPGQVEQVLINLAVNARDAMPKGGKLTIETANVALNQDYAEHHEGVEPGPYVMIAVADTGCGMDKATLQRIFEPFYTTKEVGKGTGLGLATAYGIVKQHGGHIWVYSEPGRGSTFKVYLPRVAAPQEAPLVPTGPQSGPRGTETVLIVEDDQAVRELAYRILQAHGYTVLTAGDPDEAEGLLATTDAHVDLLLTDVVMPHRSGRELFAHLVLSDPGLKVLYMSGYTDNAIVHHGVLEPNTPYLGKPFDPVALTQKVRNVLDGP